MNEGKRKVKGRHPEMKKESPTDFSFAFVSENNFKADFNANI